MIAKLDGTAPAAPINVVAAPVIDAIDFLRLRDRLLTVRDLEPHARGTDSSAF